MSFRKWALEYVFTCAMTAWYSRKRKYFAWIIRTTFENWPLYWFAKLQNKLKKEGIKI